MQLPGPAGEDNTLRFLPRGTVLAFAASIPQALRQLGAALAAGNRILLSQNEAVQRLYERIPDALRGQIGLVGEWRTASFDAVLACDEANARELARAMAERPGPIVTVLSASPGYSLDMLVKERTVSINTAAAGGNASLMTIGK
jgi:RHH-type proline utilization regulon transcriptional repressor/proline dehydrogenase/delta 1-pyrroline-5-carboxylate dehydrogenase